MATPTDAQVAAPKHSLFHRRRDSHDPKDIVESHPGLSKRAKAWLSHKFTLQCTCKNEDCERCHHHALVNHATSVSAGGGHAASHAHECDCVKHSLDTHDGDGYAFLGGYSM